MVTHVVKRDGRAEPFTSDKLSESLYAALLEVRAVEGEAALIAERVLAHVGAWLTDKTEVTSRDLRTQAGLRLAALHPDAAFAYQTYDTLI